MKRHFPGDGGRRSVQTVGRCCGRKGVLYASCFKAFGVENGKLVHGLFLILGFRLPVYVDVVQRLPDQFGGGIIIWEMSACLDDIA